MVTQDTTKIKRLEAATARRMRAEQALRLGQRLSELKCSYAAALRRGDAEDAADIHGELVDAFDAVQELERIGFYDSIAMITRCATVTPTAPGHRRCRFVNAALSPLNRNRSRSLNCAMSTARFAASGTPRRTCRCAGRND